MFFPVCWAPVVESSWMNVFRLCYVCKSYCCPELNIWMCAQLNRLKNASLWRCQMTEMLLIGGAAKSALLCQRESSRCVEFRRIETHRHWNGNEMLQGFAVRETPNKLSPSAISITTSFMADFKKWYVLVIVVRPSHDVFSAGPADDINLSAC
jgi:hypothetical protein